MNTIWLMIMLRTQPTFPRGIGLWPWPVPCAMFSPNAGWPRKKPTRAKIPSAFIIFRWSTLIGRSLANNFTNLLLGPLMGKVTADNHIDLLEAIECEPDAGLGNGGLGRLAACFIDSMATMELPAMGYGLRYEYGIFKQTIENGWQVEHPDNWLRHSDPWEVVRPLEKVEVKLNCSFEVRDGNLHPIVGRSSSLMGIPYDLPVVGYGGKTINTLRLWAAAAPDYFDFKIFSHGDFVGAVAETLAAKSITRVHFGLGMEPRLMRLKCIGRAEQRSASPFRRFTRIVTLTEGQGSAL